MAMRLPRMSRIANSGKASRSLPSRKILPWLIRAAAGNKRIMDKAVTDLPLPDSPSNANVSPLFIEKLILSTANSVCSLWPNEVCRFTTLSKGELMAYIIRPIVSCLKYVQQLLEVYIASSSSLGGMLRGFLFSSRATKVSSASVTLIVSRFPGFLCA